LRAKLKLHHLTLTLGVETVWDRKPTDPEQPINWVELKTAEEIGDDKDLLKFERKLLKFWIQSFLLGVPKIIVGFRSKRGVLLRLEEIETRTIPGAVKRKGKASWDGNVCINFTASFLDCRGLFLFLFIYLSIFAQFFGLPLLRTLRLHLC
jgi:hypothetical protein